MYTLLILLSVSVVSVVPLPKFHCQFTIGTPGFCTEVSVNTKLVLEKQLFVSGAENPAFGPVVIRGIINCLLTLAKQPIESVTLKLTVYVLAVYKLLTAVSCVLFKSGPPFPKSHCQLVIGIIPFWMDESVKMTLSGTRQLN